MSKKEERIVKKLKDAIPKMSDFDKGYILGKVEGMEAKRGAENRSAEDRKEEEDA